MLDPKKFEEFTQRFVAGLPGGFRAAQEDLERHFRSSVQGLLAKLDLVTREEFDVQTNVLARTRAKLESLEKQVRDIESRLGLEPQSPPSTPDHD